MVAKAFTNSRGSQTMNFTLSDINMTVKDRTHRTLEATPTLFSSRKGPKRQIARSISYTPSKTPMSTSPLGKLPFRAITGRESGQCNF